MYNGVVNIYKEPGFTSHDVVAKLRGITHQKKIGHTGTLDPDAVGVLCVCLGAATHICDMLTDETKEYEAVMLLGVTTDTQDTSGNVIKQCDVEVDEENVREVISHYVGNISQIPPMYSALKVDGKKLYELARQGKEVERKPRNITIHNIDIVDVNLPEVTMRVTCSKGTYIRTLCNDIGNELGCGAAMKHLTRTRVGRFSVENAVTLNQVSEYVNADRLSEILISPSDMFADLLIAIPDERGMKMAINGNIISANNLTIEEHPDFILELADGCEVRVISDEGFFYGIYKYLADRQIFKPIRMFLC